MFLLSFRLASTPQPEQLLKFYSDMDFREEFIRDLREALLHLRDSKRLMVNPLIHLFKLSAQPDKILALQDILIDAIKTFQPPGDSPSNSKKWRQYESLYYRYIEGFSQQEVADQLNLGVRHLLREQNSALEELAGYLIRQYKIQSVTVKENNGSLNGDADNLITAEESELAWLEQNPIYPPLDIIQALDSVFETTSAITKDHKVKLKMHVQENVPGLAVHPVAFNQIMINLLTVAIPMAENGWIIVNVNSETDGVRIEIRTEKSTGNSKSSLEKQTLKIEMANRLVSICGGKLEIAETISMFTSRITLPIINRQKLLIVDDNQDTLQLFIRYCSNTRYQVIPCIDASEIIDTVKIQKPDIIIIDVMMPQIDGWLVLRHLRQQPLTAGLPIVICTILPQEELAYSLGANVYLKKPVSRQEFLTVLQAISSEGKRSY